MIRKLIFLYVVLTTSTLYAQSADDILGKWLTNEGKAKVEMFKANDKYYGKIIWLKTPLDSSGQPKVDKRNPDPEKRSHRMVGLLIIRSMEFDDEEWAAGTVYDPDSGKEYNCRIELNKDGTLHIRGYIGISLVGKTTIWTRTQ